MAIMEDLAGFRAAYGPWLDRQRPLLEEKRWKEAFVGYPFVQNQASPFTPLAKPLSQCRVGLISTAGLYVREEQEPFDAMNIEGDPSFRAVPVNAARDRLAIAHDHFNHSAAIADLNSVFPLDRLNELAGESLLGGLAPLAASISGYCTRADRIAEETAPAVVEFFRRQQVDTVLHIPV